MPALQLRQLKALDFTNGYWSFFLHKYFNHGSLWNILILPFFPYYLIPLFVYLLIIVNAFWVLDFSFHSFFFLYLCTHICIPYASAYLSNPSIFFCLFIYLRTVTAKFRSSDFDVTSTHLLSSARSREFFQSCFFYWTGYFTVERVRIIQGAPQVNSY